MGGTESGLKLELLSLLRVKQTTSDDVIGRFREERDRKQRRLGWREPARLAALLLVEVSSISHSSSACP